MAENNPEMEPNKKASKPRFNRKNRAQNFRKKENTQPLQTVKRDLDQRLFAEHDSLAAAFTSLSISVQKYGVPLPITTRGIGLIIAAISRRIQRQLPNLDIPINAWYRLSLAQTEVMIYTAQRDQILPMPRGIFGEVFPDLEMIQSTSSCLVNLSPLSLVINSIGNFIVNDVQYYPRLSPQMEFNPILSTLRQFVDNAVLNQQQLYSMYRCLPGGEWRIRDGAHLYLENPDDIIPLHYGPAHLRRDIVDVKAFVAQVERKLPKFMGIVNFTSEGSASQLISVNIAQQRMTCHMHDDLVFLDGESDGFNSLQQISTPHQAIGIASLFGETAEANLIAPNQASRIRMSQSCGYNVQWEDIINSMLA